jgi:uncharacterized protein YxjI
MAHRQGGQEDGHSSALVSSSETSDSISAGVKHGTRYRLAAQLVAAGDDFYVQTDSGQRAFKIDGVAIRTRDMLRFSDLHGNVLCEIRPRLASVREAIHVTDAGGERIVSVRRHMVTPVRDRFTIDVVGGPTLDVTGNVVAHEFEVVGPSGRVATVSKRWFRARGSYGVEIAPGQTDVQILAAIVAMDQMIGDLL